MASKYADLSDEEKAEKAKEMQELIHKMEKEVQKGYIGQEDVIHKILLCVAAGGNILLEGVPGLGKSFLVETLARVVDGTEMHRIQFTPDKLPSDIVGTEAYNEDKGFYVEKGPIFGNFILADEINRAPPKVQSAMLEAMQEHKVSIGDETFSLPEPFFTMATQNPVEQGGSLHPDETLYMNGQLWKADKALEHAKENGELVHEDEDKRIYNAGGSTNNLSLIGDVEQTNCKVYEKDYEGKVYTIKTRTGRKIKVNADHPLLVNQDGEIIWKKAEELEEKEFLVQPETLNLPEEGFSGHEEVMEKLDAEFKTVSREDIKEGNYWLQGDEFDNKNIDDLRIAAGMTKKELANKADTDYEQTLKYLNGSSSIAEEKLAEFLKTEDFQPDTYLESYKAHRISDAWSNEDAGFFLGFTLAEGKIEDNAIEVSQKNYPELIERWISLGEKLNLKVDKRMKEDVKHAKIRSKPFVRYLEERYHLGQPEKLLSAPRAFKREFLDAFMQAESYFENDKKENNVRVTMTQQDEKLTNTISYLFSDFGIRPKIYNQNKVYRLRISDKDLHTYLDTFTWPGEEPELNEESSAYRVVPVDGKLIDELVTKLGFKQCGSMTEKEWYGLYHMAKQRGRVSEYELKKFVNSMEEVIEEKRSQEYDSIQEEAQSVGIPMTEIVEETTLSKHKVWTAYQGKSKAEEAEEFIEREKEVRLQKSKQMISNLRKLIESDVFYDPIQEIQEEEYEGPVIGLSVPETHNYIAGLGACGINHNTYPLPEAQIDRFLFKIYLDYPKKHNEQKIIDMNANIQDMDDFDVGAVVTEEDVLNIQEFAKVVTVRDEIKAYIVDLVDASRNPEDYGMEYSDYIDWGCTPRASINLALAGRANAMYNGRHYVTPEDIRAVIHDVFVHRIILNYEGEAQGLEIDDVIENIVDRVPVR